MMKVDTIRYGFLVLIFNGTAYATGDSQSIMIQNIDGKTFTVPKSVAGAALLAWFKQNNHTIPAIIGFLPENLEKEVIMQEREKQEVIARKLQEEREAAARQLQEEREAAARAEEAARIKAQRIQHYLHTGEGKTAAAHYPDCGYSIKQLREHGRLQAQTGQRTVTIDKNLLKIFTVSLTHQLINDITGLEAIGNLARCGYIDLSNNRIATLNMEFLQQLNNTLYYPITLDLCNNPFKMTKEISHELAKLPYIVILAS
ncbi:MAG: hypothetical protein WD068_02400 [Candidatus Babeliales bacterium]